MELSRLFYANILLYTVGFGGEACWRILKEMIIFA